MANYSTTTTQRPSSNAPSPPPSQGDESRNSPSPRKNSYTLSFSCPFNIPPSPESAAVRIVKNLEKFGLYYSIFIWTVLFIALVPARKVSVVYLVGTTEVAFLFSLLLRAFPDSVILHRIIDKKFVYFLLFVITAMELILTKAALHLFVVLASTLPIVMIHAALSKREDVVLSEGGEMALLVQEKLGDVVAQSDNLV